MNEKRTPTTRRAILGASAIGLYAAATGAANAGGERTEDAAAPGNGIAPLLRIVADRKALAAHREIGLGTQVALAEPLRRGIFIARARNLHQGEVVADPYQAFCVASTVDQDIVWLRDYCGPASLDWGGAKGDGVADDAPFINAMLANRYANWFQIEDRRTHRLGEPLRIRRPLTLTGGGVGRSILRITAPIDAINIAMSSESDHGLHLAHFGIVNAMPVGAPTAGSGVRLNLAYLCRLSDLRIVNCWNGIHATRSGLSNIEGLRVENPVNAGLLFDGGGNFDTRVTGFTISGGTYAIRLRDMCDELLFSDGVLSSARWAVYADAAAHSVNQRPEFCRFSRVSFDSCTNGIDLSHCTDFVFDGCFVSCRPGHGAELGVRGPAENIQFVATTFFNNARSAAVVGAQASEIDFLACKFVGNAVAGTDDTLVFRTGCGSFSLAQNRFRQGWGVNGRPHWQVRIERGGAGDYVMTGNHLAPGSVGTLLDERRSAARAVTGNIGI